MTFKYSLAVLTVAIVSLMGAPADARTGNDAQGLRQRDTVADPAVKIFRKTPHSEWSYPKRHDPGFNARNRCGHNKYWNGTECVWR